MCFAERATEFVFQSKLKDTKMLQFNKFLRSLQTGASIRHHQLVFNQRQFCAVDSEFVTILFVSARLCLCSLSRLCFPLSPSSSAIPPSVLCVSILPPLCASGQTSWALVYPLILAAAEKSRRAATQTQLLQREVVSRNLLQHALLMSAALCFCCWEESSHLH